MTRNEEDIKGCIKAITELPFSFVRDPNNPRLFRCMMHFTGEFMFREEEFSLPPEKLITTLRERMAMTITDLETLLARVKPS